MNFERNINPLKAMDIGLKVYRCGHCGTFTDHEGSPLHFESEELKQAEAIVNQIGDDKTELVNGKCCDGQQFMQMRVTRDMAIDAGDLSLEGTFY